MAYYTVYYHWVDSRGKVKRGHTKLDASNKDDAKRRVIRGEKPQLIAVDKVLKR